MKRDEHYGYMIIAKGEGLSAAFINYCPFCGRKLKD